MTARLSASIARVVLIAALLVGANAAAAGGYSPATEAVQHQLTELGFDPGPVDGLMGGRTRAAIRAFQQREGLDPDGLVGPATRRALAAAGARPETGALEAATGVPTEAPAAPSAPEVPARAAPEPARSSDASTAAPEPPAPSIAAAAPWPVTPDPPAETSPEAAAGERVLSYDTLGWHGPQAGDAALTRHRTGGGSPEMGRESGEMIVPRGEDVYVLRPAASVPGLDCDPRVGLIEVEFMLGNGGPISVRSLDGDGFCRLGFGIVLAVGQTLEMRQAYWGEREFPAGRVRVGPQGLEYVTR